MRGMFLIVFSLFLIDGRDYGRPSHGEDDDVGDGGDRDSDPGVLHGSADPIRDRAGDAGL